jgi:Kef-type K+ transport system membrane component KefB
VLALGVLFAKFNVWMALFIGTTVPLLWILPKVTPWVIARWGNRTSEPEVKFFLLVLFVLGWLATSAKSEAVLPAYLVGLVTAGAFVKDRALLHRMRTMAFAVLTPFYFLKAGLFVSLPAVAASFGLTLAFLGVKVASKFMGVGPATRAFGMAAREGTYTTLLMSTGLTFGSISALFGLINGVIDQGQYTILVASIIGSAVVPTLVAQAWFRPRITLLGKAGPSSVEPADAEALPLPARADLPGVGPARPADQKEP